MEFLELEADKAQQRGENPQELRNYYRDLLGLTGASESALKSQSARALTTIRDIDQQIKTIIQTERAKFPRGEVRPGQTVPPPPAILAQLDQQKGAATLQGITELRGLMSGEDFEKVDRYLHQEFARNLTVLPVPSNPPPAKPLSQSAEEAAQ